MQCGETRSGGVRMLVPGPIVGRIPEREVWMVVLKRGRVERYEGVDWSYEGGRYMSLERKREVGVWREDRGTVDWWGGVPLGEEFCVSWIMDLGEGHIELRAEVDVMCREALEMRGGQLFEVVWDRRERLVERIRAVGMLLRNNELIRAVLDEEDFEHEVEILESQLREWVDAVVLGGGGLTVWERLEAVEYFAQGLGRYGFVVEGTDVAVVYGKDLGSVDITRLPQQIVYETLNSGVRDLDTLRELLARLEETNSWNMRLVFKKNRKLFEKIDLPWHCFPTMMRAYEGHMLDEGLGHLKEFFVQEYESKMRKRVQELNKLSKDAKNRIEKMYYGDDQRWRNFVHLETELEFLLSEYRVFTLDKGDREVLEGLNAICQELKAKNR